jgi:hypothetical protein
VGDVRGREVLRQAVAVQVGGLDFAAFRDEEVGCCEAKAGRGACSDAERKLAGGEQGEIWRGRGGLRTSYDGDLAGQAA